MPNRWRIALLLLSSACSSGRTPLVNDPAPAPPPQRPTLDPLGLEPARELFLRYPAGGAGISRYAFSERDSVVATMPSGDTQVQVLGRTAWLTLTWVAADTGTRITATVDSVRPDSGLAGLGAMLDSARGARWTTLRQPRGHLVNLTGGPRSLVGDKVRDQLQLLFPLIPAEGARPGATWTDSTGGPTRLSAFEATETALYSGAAEALVSANGALPLRVIRSRSASGQGTQFGQPITVRATGSDTLSYQFATDGRVLSVSGIRVTDLVIELPSVGQSVPAREISTLRMALLR